MNQITNSLKWIIEFILLLAILLGAAIAPGLLSAGSSTIQLAPHHTILTMETTP